MYQVNLLVGLENLCSKVGGARLVVIFHVKPERQAGMLHMDEAPSPTSLSQQCQSFDKHNVRGHFDMQVLVGRH